jgi:hypothetical protein
MREELLDRTHTATTDVDKALRASFMMFWLEFLLGLRTELPSCRSMKWNGNSLLSYSLCGSAFGLRATSTRSRLLSGRDAMGTVTHLTLTFSVIMSIRQVM